MTRRKCISLNLLGMGTKIKSYCCCFFFLEKLNFSCAKISWLQNKVTPQEIW